MIAGASPSAKRTLPVRSPWTSWLGASSGSIAATSRGTCFTWANSAAGRSPQATRSPIAHRSVRSSRKWGRGTPRSAAWSRSPHTDDLPPPAVFVPAVDECLPAAPALDDERTVRRPQRESDAEAVGGERGEELCLPREPGLRHVERLEDDLAAAPRLLLPAAERLRRRLRAEGREHGRARLETRHVRRLVRDVLRSCGWRASPSGSSAARSRTWTPTRCASGCSPTATRKARTPRSRSSTRAASRARP